MAKCDVCGERALSSVSRYPTLTDVPTVPETKCAPRKSSCKRFSSGFTPAPDACVRRSPVQFNVYRFIKGSVLTQSNRDYHINL